jgi:hypothetical protein
VIAPVLASLILVAAGWPLAAALDEDRPPLARRLGEAYLLGAGAVALLLFIGIPWSRLSIVVMLAVVALAFGLVARNRLAADLGFRFSAASLIDLLTVVVVAGYARLATAGPSPETDHVIFWGLKAKKFWLARGIDWQFLENPFNAFAHVDYPLLVPLQFDWLTIAAGGWPDRWLGVVNVAYGIATLLVVRSFLAEEIEPPWQRSLVLLAITPVALSPWIGIAEGPLVAYATTGLLYVRRGEIERGALHLGLAAMCKNEGLALVVSAAVATLLVAGVRRLARFWPAAAIVVPWLVLRRLHHLQTDLTTSGIVSRVFAHLQNPEPIFHAMAQYSLGKPMLWIGVLAALVVGMRDLVRRERFLAIAISVQLLFYVSAYLVTPRDVVWHVRWSWERIVNQIAPTLVFLSLVLVSRAIDRDTMTKGKREIEHAAQP